jgi:hypothetical protein
VTVKDKRIDEICDERSTGGDFFVYLVPGFAISDPPQKFAVRCDKFTRADAPNAKNSRRPCRDTAI